MKHTLAVIALEVLALLGASDLHAQPAVYPPPEYDRPYAGKLVKIEAKDSEEMLSLCAESKSPIACARQYGVVACTIVIAPEAVLRRWGWTVEIVMRHELAHCNGWPADHPGARRWPVAVTP
jgi:hypothetical protein